MDPRVSARHLAMIERNRPTIVSETVVENHEAGLLQIEGRLLERLPPGRHAFWVVGRKIEVKRLDLRPQCRNHRAGDADQGPHRATGDADRVPADRRSRGGGVDGAGRGCLAVPVGAESKQKTPASLPGFCICCVGRNGWIRNPCRPCRRPGAFRRHRRRRRSSSAVRPPWLRW